MLVVAALGVGSAALAQPQLVVDPWGSAKAEQDSWFAETANERPNAPAADPALVDPWLPAPRAKRVEVYPIAPVTNAPPKSAVELPQSAPLVIDPWAPVVVSEMPSLGSGLGPRVAGDRSPWSGRMIEVVDPWGRASALSVSERVQLIIDPWTR
jgi:hypothetical protein